MLDGWMENALQPNPPPPWKIATARSCATAAPATPRPAAHWTARITDLQVIYAPKSMPARDASTGEQKALLIGLVLAHANLVAEMTGITPLLLLDEVVAHLDPGRRAA